MALTISREQRNGIYGQVLTHPTGIGDVWIEIENRDFARAKRLGRAFAEDLRLLDALGWSETIDGERVTLAIAPDEPARTVARLHRDASAALETYVSRPKDDEAQVQRELAASEALGEILSQLAEPAAAVRAGARPAAGCPTAGRSAQPTSPLDRTPPPAVSAPGSSTGSS